MKPLRIVVFATEQRTKGRGKNKRTEPHGYAYMGWTETQAFSEARLPGAGSFLFAGLHTTYRAAQAYLALPETHQVAIKTNQDKTVYRYFKAADGSVTGYGGQA